MVEEDKQCPCTKCKGEFNNSACDNLLEVEDIEACGHCTDCREGVHVKSYRVFCETIVYARDEESAYELGYQDIKDEDYSLEEVK